MKKNYEIILFKDNEFSLDVRADIENETVWLTQNEMARLFNVSIDNISLHIKNILQEKELDISTTEESSIVQKEGNRYIKRNVNVYNLDMIISVGYRIKSKRGILFRQWANKVLKDYLIKGYAYNEQRLLALNKTIEIQNRMLSATLEIEIQELNDVINAYTNALTILDDYDHQEIKEVKKLKITYELTYKESRKIIDSMSFNKSSTLFGKEKEKGKLEGILKNINQTAFGQEIYPTLESKSVHLLYFLIKDHPFQDGCKRIAATLFLEYLNKNGALFINKMPIFSNGTLAACTLLVAESKPEEMDIIIKVLENIFFNN